MFLPRLELSQSGNAARAVCLILLAIHLQEVLKPSRLLELVCTDTIYRSVVVFSLPGSICALLCHLVLVKFLIFHAVRLVLGVIPGGAERAGCTYTAAESYLLTTHQHHCSSPSAAASLAVICVLFILPPTSILTTARGFRTCCLLAVGRICRVVYKPSRSRCSPNGPRKIVFSLHVHSSLDGLLVYGHRS